MPPEKLREALRAKTKRGDKVKLKRADAKKLREELEFEASPTEFLIVRGRVVEVDGRTIEAAEDDSEGLEL